MKPPRYWEFGASLLRWSWMSFITLLILIAVQPGNCLYGVSVVQAGASNGGCWKSPPRRLEFQGEKHHRNWTKTKNSNCLVNGQCPNYWLTIVCMAHHLGFEHLIHRSLRPSWFTLKVGRLLFCWCPVPWVPMTSSMRPCRTVWVWKSDMEVWETMSPP